MNAFPSWTPEEVAKLIAFHKRHAAPLQWDGAPAEDVDALETDVDKDCLSFDVAAYIEADALQKRASEAVHAPYSTGAAWLPLQAAVRLADGTLGVVSGHDGSRVRVSYFARRAWRVRHVWVEACSVEAQA